MKYFLFLISTLLLGCENFKVKDGDPIQQNFGYVGIYLELDHDTNQNYYQSTKETPVGLTLEKINDTETVYIAKFEPNRPVIIKLSPGTWKLNRVSNSPRNLHWHVTFDEKKAFQFSVRANQINYPGNWVVKSKLVAFKVSGNLSSGSSRSTSRELFLSYNNGNIKDLFKKYYPSLMSRLPWSYTGL